MFCCSTFFINLGQLVVQKLRVGVTCSENLPLEQNSTDLSSKKKIEVVVLQCDVPCGGLPIVPYSDIQIVRCAKIVRSFRLIKHL